MVEITVQNFRIRALGKIAIRCADMDTIVACYRDIIGLELLTGGHRADITFFKIAKGFGGHTSVLVLFRHDAGREELHLRSDQSPVTGGNSSLHHITLSLPFNEQEAMMVWYDENGIDYKIQRFGWIGWRGIFTKNPEGNTVELVAYDPSMLDEPNQA